MRRSRWILLLTLLVLAVATSWLWWVKPKTVDMAAYAPADSLLYLEASQPLEVVDTLTDTAAWKALEKTMGAPVTPRRNRWLQGFIRWTGIGPIESVILARAQIAVVVTNLGTTEEGDTLRIKPEGAILIETHTSEVRIRARFEQALKTLAEKTYRRPISRRMTHDGLDFIEWSSPEGSRQIVGTTIGSLIIVGNSEQAVQDCVAVSLGRRTSLKDDPELARMRAQLGGEPLLTFGYVPPGNSARLLAVGLPLLLGRAPADSEFQRLITSGAAKVFGSLSWTSRAYLTGIEDRYLITLQPSVVDRLRPNFGPTNFNSRMQRLLPADVYSVTSYKFADPAATWLSLKTAVSSQVDALSTIVFSSLLKSSLLSYGINDPESFLSAVNGEVLTLRLDENAERSILIAGVGDRAKLRDFVTKTMGFTLRAGGAEGETFEDPQGELAASFIGDFMVVGYSAGVRSYAAIKQANTEISAEKLKRITLFFPLSSSANIVTYTDDGDRVRSFMTTVIAARAAPPVTLGRLEEAIDSLPFSVTETTLTGHSIERTTRSPLGQFSTILPLVVPEQLSSANTGMESK